MVAVELAVVRGEPVNVVDARQVVGGLGRRARPARRPRSAASANLVSFSAITASFSRSMTACHDDLTHIGTCSTTHRTPASGSPLAPGLLFYLSTVLEYLSIYLSQSRITRTSPRNPCSSASPLQPTDTGVEIAVAPVTDTGLLPKIAALAECRPSDALWPDPLKRKCGDIHPATPGPGSS